MKKTLLLCMLFLSLDLYTTAQCDGNLFFDSQEQVDQFIIDYPTCTNWAGSIQVTVTVTSSGTVINNVDALQNLVSVYGLSIEVYEPELNFPLSLNGLSDLTTCNGLFTYNITDFTGLQNLTSVTGQLNISNSINAPNLSQFTALESVGNMLLGFYDMPFSSIDNAFPALINLEAFGFYPVVSGFDLGSLSGFNSVTTLGSFDGNVGNQDAVGIGELNILNNLISAGQLELDFNCGTFSSFQNLEYADGIGGYLETTSGSNLDISFPSLTSCSILYIEARALVTYNFNNLQNIVIGPLNGDLTLVPVCATGLSLNVNLPSLLSVAGSLNIDSYYPFPCNEIAPDIIFLPALNSIGGNLMIAGTSLNSITFLNSLQSVMGEISITNNAQLTNCDIEVLCDKLTNSPAQVTIENNAAGCANASEISLSCNENSVAGTVYADLDCDGIYNNNDVIVSNPIMLDDNGIPFGSSFGGGQYFIPIDYNSTISFVPQTPSGLLPASSLSVTTDATAVAYTGFDFALCPNPTIHDLAINVTTGWGVPRPGFQNYYIIYVTNQSGNTEAATLVFDISNMPGATIADADGGVVSGNTVTWNIDAIPGFQTIYFVPKISVDITTPLGTAYSLFSSVTMLTNTDQDLTNNSDSATQTVIGSYDPNDITVDIEAYNYDLLPANDGLELEYSIRFQNTGTAEAINVRVTDLIEQDLDISSIHMIAASHPYQLSFDANGQVEWLFENIMLPDSGANEELSHGFIHFSIKTQAGLTTQNTIDNSVAIYFDFNEAVITNTATTIFYQCPQQITAAGNTVVCEGESLDLTASGGWSSYQWMLDGDVVGSEMAINLDGLIAGIYTLNYSGGTTYCQSSDMLEVQILETPLLPVVTQNGNTLTASGIGLFTWMLNGLALDEMSNTLQITQSGNYSVMQTINGCSSDVTSGNYTYTSIVEWDIMNNITIWPNPMTDQTVMTCHLNGMTDVHMHLTDATGRIIKSYSIKTNITTIDRNGLESGVYFITITANGSQLGASKRLVVN